MPDDRLGYPQYTDEQLADLIRRYRADHATMLARAEQLELDIACNLAALRDLETVQTARRAKHAARGTHVYRPEGAGRVVCK